MTMRMNEALEHGSGEARAAIDRLARQLDCEAILIRQPAETEEVLALIGELAERIGQAVTLSPLAAPGEGVPPRRRFRLTERDRQVVTALARYRYLRTGQIHRLIFAPQSGPQMTRRRLRFLAAPDFAYLQKVEFFVSGNAIQQESAYFLGPQGIALLGELGLPPPPFSTERPGRVKHRFLEHALDLSEFRVKLELALRNHPVLELQRFIADFEVKEHLQNATARERFKLYHAFPGGTERLIVYPDALLILRHKPTGARRLYFVEIDRGTEGGRVLRAKAAAYRLYEEQQIYRKFGDFPHFRVLLQAPSAKHAQAVRRALAGCKGEELFWTAAAGDLQPDTLLAARVWTTSSGKAQSIFQTPKPPVEPRQSLPVTQR